MMFRAIATLLLVVVIGSVVTHADTIGLYAALVGTNCNIVDHTSELLIIYVVHVSPTGATALQFSAPKPECMAGAIWMADVWPYEAIGNSQTGAAFSYGSCQTGVIPVMYMLYLVQGTSEPCCLYPVLPDPHAGGEVLVVDCDSNTVPAAGLTSTVNGDASCPCGYPVPVEETTWGRLKSVYTE